VPDDKLVKSYMFMGEMMVTFSDVIMIVGFGPKEMLKADRLHKDVPSERETLARAWAMQFAIMPPENIQAIVGMNLALAYVSLFMPRMIRAWTAKNPDDVDGVAGLIRGAIEKRKEKKNERREADREGKADGAPGAVSQEAGGDERRGAESEAPGEGGAGGKAN
jgi:hypothetical protein